MLWSSKLKSKLLGWTSAPTTKTGKAIYKSTLSKRAFPRETTIHNGLSNRAPMIISVSNINEAKKTQWSKAFTSPSVDRRH